MSERTVEIPGNMGQKLRVTEREVKNEKGEKVPYLAFANGMESLGIYLGENTKAELAKFLTEKPKKGSGNGTK